MNEIVDILARLVDEYSVNNQSNYVCTDRDGVHLVQERVYETARLETYVEQE